MTGVVRRSGGHEPSGLVGPLARRSGRRSARRGRRVTGPIGTQRHLRGAASVAASVLGLASTLGLASGPIADAVRRCVGIRDTDGVSAGAPATGCPTDACCTGSATGATAGSAAVTCGGTPTRRRSGASIRRSCQGKRKPGSQSPWPPKVRLNSHAWISSESSSADVSRLRSRLMRWLSARRWNLWNSSVLRRRRSGSCWRGAGWHHVRCACRPDAPTGHGLAKAPQRHS